MSQSHPPRTLRRRPSRLIALALCAALGSPAVAFGQAGDAAEQAYAQARRAYKAGDYEAAVRHLEEAYRARPEPIFRYHMARSYEAAKRPTDAVEAAIAFIEQLARENADAQIYGEPVVEAQRMIARLGVGGGGAAEKPGPLRLALPLARVCPEPVVTMGGKRLPVERESLYWQTEVPPVTGAGGDVSIRCEGLEAPPSGRSTGEVVSPWILGAGIAATAVGGYFTARYFIADGELGDQPVVTDEADLGPAAREKTRTRQQRDDFGEAALIWGGVGVGLLVTGAIVALASGDGDAGHATLAPSASGDGASVWWQGRF